MNFSKRSPERGAGEQARQAIAAGFDRIVACGGDGTVFDIIQGMAGSPVPLGIIPFGTGNVLAQNLRIPHDAAAAARWILKAHPRSIALGKITHCTPQGKQKWYFAMTAGMGVHAALMTAAQRSKKNMGGRAAYFTAGLQLLFQHPLEPFHLEITLTSGEVIERNACEAIAVRVGELNIWRPGGGFDLPFLRLASLESGNTQNQAANGSRWQLARASFEGLFLGAGSRERRMRPKMRPKMRPNAPARYEDATRIVLPLHPPASSMNIRLRYRQTAKCSTPTAPSSRWPTPTYRCSRHLAKPTDLSSRPKLPGPPASGLCSLGWGATWRTCIFTQRTVTSASSALHLSRLQS